MHDLWLIGIAAGIGVALGLAAGGAFARLTRAPVAAAAVALVLGGVLGWVIVGTPVGTAILFAGAGVIAFVVSLIPILGFVEAVAIPVVALRSRRRADEKYAGLRTLAK
jgi:hypothetical protein